MRTLTKHKPNLKRQLAIVIALLFCSLNSSAAEVYKWVDEHGNTHYSDKKPNNQDHKSMNVYSGQPSKARKDIYEQTQALSERDQRAEQAKNEREKEEARKKDIEQKCAVIRENLKIISETSRIRVEDNGEMRMLSQEEIAKKKARHEEQLKEFCQ